MLNYELLRRQLSHDKIDEVLSSLLEIENIDSETKDSIILVSSEWSDWKRKEMSGFSGSSESKLKLVFRLLKIISHLEGQGLNGNEKEKRKEFEELERKIEQSFEKIEQIKCTIKETDNSNEALRLKGEEIIQRNNYMILIKTYEKIIAATFVGISAYSILKNNHSNPEYHHDSTFFSHT